MRHRLLRNIRSATAALVVGGLLGSGFVANAELGAAPNFTLASRDGGAVSLADHAGDVVMVNFWATWCGPCREEMPHLESLHQRYRSLGFTLLGVNVEENSQDALDWLEEMPVSFPILFDPENRVSELYDVIAMPSTVLIDRQGMVRHIHHGYQAGYENEYQTQIRALIRE
ncbi:MAG TPA: TlpA disulfide reductase family protein [Gammaproteobacteria bacterium]